MAKRKSRFISEAAQQALVRFGPELSGLRELQRQAEKNFSTGVQTARVSGAAIGAAIDEAAPQVARIYDRAGLDQARVAHTLVGQDLAGLGGVANSIKAGASLEAGAMAGRLGESRANALTELQTRGVQAREGEGFAVKKARDEFVEAIGQVLRRKQDVRREKGAFTSATAADLEEASRDRALRLRVERLGNEQSERNSLRSAGIDPETGKPIPNGKLDPETKKPKKGTVSGTGRKLLTGEKHLETQNKISQGVAALRTLDPDRAARGEAAPLLVDGHKAQELYDPATGKKQISKTGTPKKTPDIPGVGGLMASVAADVYYDGHVSRKNTKRLADAGFSLKQLGLPTYGEWKKSGGRQKLTPQQKAGLDAAKSALLGG